jgi:hypothetical protein
LLTLLLYVGSFVLQGAGTLLEKPIVELKEKSLAYQNVGRLF